MNNDGSLCYFQWLWSCLSFLHCLSYLQIVYAHMLQEDGATES